MKRLLLYVHYNKLNKVSSHVTYQLKQLRPIFSKIVFISNSPISDSDFNDLTSHKLIDQFVPRQNEGFDFAAWHDGMLSVGFDSIQSYDSVTIMNDTCFGPLWDFGNYYLYFESDDKVDFWGLTNHRATKQFKEHIQSYFISFKKSVIISETFRQFWMFVESFSNVQDVIANYESKMTTVFVEAGFKYKVIFDTSSENTENMLHPDFSYYNPTSILSHKVPFIKVKTIDANQSITPFILDEIERTSSYPVDLIVSHMSKINYPDFPYLLSRKYLETSVKNNKVAIQSKIAVHLHVFYVDLLQEFLDSFSTWSFAYDLFITTDSSDKESEIQKILSDNSKAAEVLVTGNIGRDVLPMLKLKDSLSQYDYVGHFHTKKSKEADYWAGQSWRTELIEILVKPADSIIGQFESSSELGIVIADIPSFFRFNKIVDAWNEHQIAPGMNDLWQKMSLTKEINFEAFHSFVMSYGTFVWFRYEALRPLFDLELSDQEVPKEPLPQNSVLHAIERLLVYIAWDQNYDFKISRNPKNLTPFIDNKVLNLRGSVAPNTFVDFNYMGGIKGALKYIVVGPARAVKYIVKRIIRKIK